MASTKLPVLSDSSSQIKRWFWVRSLSCGHIGNDGDLRGSSGGDVITGLGGDDTIKGLAGDDYITGGAGDDTIGGGLGDDAAVYSGAFNAYTITTNQNGSITVSHDNGGADGTDTLTGVGDP